MTFGLLGPLLVRSGGSELPVQRGGQRVVLAALLLDANRVVSADTLTELLWDLRPPPSALDVIRHHVWRLRQALGEAGPERIVTHARGYLIRVGDGELDLHRFLRLLAACRAAARDSAWELAAARAGEALSLWRGEPLADAESQTLMQREVPRLDELRLQAEEARAEAELQLGRHDVAAAELSRLCAAHPLREHVRALLMLALYRCGRQADALAAYQDVRQVLVEELGTEPGGELRHLHQQVLTADPALDLPALGQITAAAAGPGVSGGAGRGAAGGVPGDVPRQLPAVVEQFTGRAAELAALKQILTRQAAGEAPGTVVISAIGGTAGVGKTALAIHFAHQAAPAFPGGQLYANLRGFGPGGTPAAPAEAIGVFLEALGVPADRIPPSPEGQAGLYRSLLADRRMLIVLDNACDEQQVRPLLPASPGSLVIVTSRRQLTGLAAADGARLLTLDVLTDDEARQMLAARIGATRAAAEPAAVAEIASLCAGLPLALAVAGARASACPTFPLTALASELRDAGRRLEVLDGDDAAASVRAVLSWSYDQLSAEAAGMFRLLGLHPGPDISVPAAASLAGLPPALARRLLAELVRAYLVAEHAPGRYAFHDLLRAYACDQACAIDNEASRRRGTGRMLDHYLHTSHAAAQLFSMTPEPVTMAPPCPGVTPEQITGEQQAIAWYQAELRVLLAIAAVAAKSGFDVHAWQIPCFIAPFLDRRGPWQEEVRVLQDAVTAATRLGDIPGQAASRRRLAHAHTWLREWDQAEAHLMRSLSLYRQAGDHLGEARIHVSLSYLEQEQDRPREAIRYSEQALRLFQAAGHQTPQASMLNNIGHTLARLGDHEQGLVFCRQALDLARELGQRQVEAHTWDSLGYVEHQAGHHARAADCYLRSLSLVRELGDRRDEGEILVHLGDAHEAAGDLRQARAAWEQALPILDELGRREAGPVRAKLSGSGSGSGDAPQEDVVVGVKDGERLAVGAERDVGDRCAPGIQRVGELLARGHFPHEDFAVRADHGQERAIGRIVGDPVHAPDTRIFQAGDQTAALDSPEPYAGKGIAVAGGANRQQAGGRAVTDPGTQAGWVVRGSRDGADQGAGADVPHVDVAGRAVSGG